MTLNELIDSLIVLREKENAGECPVMFFREVYLYSVDEPFISWMSNDTGQQVDGYEDYEGSYESFLEEHTRIVAAEGYM